MNGMRLAHRIVSECEKMGAESVELIDVRKRAPLFDFLVIATVDNTVLADALLTKVMKTVKPDPGVSVVTESGPESDWVVCDYGDVVLHVFIGSDVRQRYDLEGLWSHISRRRSASTAESEAENLKDQ